MLMNEASRACTLASEIYLVNQWMFIRPNSQHGNEKKDASPHGNSVIATFHGHILYLWRLLMGFLMG